MNLDNLGGGGVHNSYTPSLDQIPKAQTKPYCAYPKVAQSKERGKKRAKNTIKQNIMLLRLLIEPLEE